MRTLQLSALAAAAAAVAFGLFYHFLPAGAIPDAGPYMHAVFPEASSSVRVAGAYPYYKAVGPQGAEGVFFVTTDLAPDVRGYSGKVPVVVGLLPSGRLSGIKILSNNETPSYAQRVDRPRFTGQFAGKPIFDPFKVDADVDGVTRATVTARAVTDGVRQASRRAGSDIFGYAYPKEESALTRGLKDPAVYVLAALFAASLVLYLKGRQSRSRAGYRYVVLVLSLVFLGVVKASPFALGNVFSLASLRLPGLDGLFWYVLVIGSLVAAVMFGRLYCGWLCPYGALQELLALLPVRKLRLDSALDDKARVLKYVILWAVTVAAFTTGLLEIGNFEPYGTLFSGHGGVLAWGLVGVTLGAGLVVPRAWCRYLCPVGALLGLLSGVSIIKRKPFGGCDRCCACAGVCSMGNRAEGEAGYNPRECIGCNRCVEVCPKR